MKIRDYVSNGLNILSKAALPAVLSLGLAYNSAFAYRVHKKGETILYSDKDAITLQVDKNNQPYIDMPMTITKDENDNIYIDSYRNGKLYVSLNCFGGSTCAIWVNDEILGEYNCSKVLFFGSGNDGTLKVLGRDVMLEGNKNKLKIIKDEGDKILISQGIENNLNIIDRGETLEHLVLKDDSGKEYKLQDRDVLKIQSDRMLSIENLKTNYRTGFLGEFLINFVGFNPEALGLAKENLQNDVRYKIKESDLDKEWKDKEGNYRIEIKRKKDGKIMGNVFIVYEQPQASMQDARIVTVSVGADEEFIEKCNENGLSWKGLINDYFERVSQNYSKNFGVEFKIVEHLQWESDNDKDYDGFIERFEKTKKTT